jgi:hypothetical protein
MDLQEIGIDRVNWIWLAQDRIQWWAFVKTVMNLSSGSTKKAGFF